MLRNYYLRTFQEQVFIVLFFTSSELQIDYIQKIHGNGHVKVWLCQLNIRVFNCLNSFFWCESRCFKLKMVIDCRRNAGLKKNPSLALIEFRNWFSSNVLKNCIEQKCFFIHHHISFTIRRRTNTAETRQMVSYKR